MKSCRARLEQVEQRVARLLETEEGGPLCVGLSARISRVDTVSGTRSDFITGLVSAGEPLFAIGASGVAVQGNQIMLIDAQRLASAAE